jgi:hypothetical protein
MNPQPARSFRSYSGLHGSRRPSSQGHHRADSVSGEPCGERRILRKPRGDRLEDPEARRRYTCRCPGPDISKVRLDSRPRVGQPGVVDGPAEVVCPFILRDARYSIRKEKIARLFHNHWTQEMNAMIGEGALHFPSMNLRRGRVRLTHSL